MSKRIQTKVTRRFAGVPVKLVVIMGDDQTYRCEYDQGDCYINRGDDPEFLTGAYGVGDTVGFAVESWMRDAARRGNP